MVKIYSITATNAVDGVAASCRACALGSEQSGSSCVPCPPGDYIEKETNQCKECPPDTSLSVHQVYGQEACIPCGPGSRSTRVSESTVREKLRSALECFLRSYKVVSNIYRFFFTPSLVFSPFPFIDHLVDMFHVSASFWGHPILRKALK